MNSETNKDTIDYSTSECSGKLVAGTRLDQWLKEGNTPADRRFCQVAGPFTLKPGAVNNLTVGVVYGRSFDG